MAQGAPTDAPWCAYNKGTFNETHMTETLSLDILALIDGLEADLDAAGIDTDADIDLDEEV